MNKKLLLGVILAGFGYTIMLMGIIWTLTSKVLGGILLAIGVPMTLAGTVLIIIQAKQERAQQKNEQKEKEIQKKAKTALAMIAKYRSLTTTTLDGNGIDKDKLLIVAKNYGAKTMDEAMEMYNLAIETERQTELAKIKKEQDDEQKKAEEQYLKLRKADIAVYEKQKAEASLCGKNKYSHKIEKKIKEFEDGAKSRELSKNIAYDMAHRYAKTNDAVSGIIYNGVIVDAERIKRNAEENASRTRAQGQKLLEALEQNEKELKPTKKETIFCEYVNTRLVDEENIQAKFKELCISGVKYTVTKGNNFKVSGKIECNNTYTIAEQPAVLDGALLVKVKDEKGATVASGYVSTPWGNGTDLRTAGFQGEVKFSSLCLVAEKICKQLDFTKKYTCDIEPIAMWIIEV